MLAYTTLLPHMCLNSLMQVQGSLLGYLQMLTGSTCQTFCECSTGTETCLHMPWYLQ